MALPPWTVELLRRGVSDLAKQVNDAETAQAIKDQASKLVEELPRVARERVGALLRQAESTTQPLRDLWAGSAASHALEPTALINASGTLFHSRGAGVPLPEAVWRRGTAMLMGDHTLPDAIVARWQNEMAEQIGVRCQRSDLAVFIASSLDAGLAFLTLAANGSPMVVPRHCAQAIAHDGAVLADRLNGVGAAIREVGTVEGFDGNDLLPDDPTGRPSWLVQRWDARRNIDRSLIHDRNLRHVVVMPRGRMFPVTSSQDPFPDVCTSLQAGTDAVILVGGVLNGMPELCLVVGSKESLGSGLSSYRSRSSAAPAAWVAMAASAIQYEERGSLPVDQLANTSVENLSDRAARLATQLAGLEVIASARMTERNASWEENQDGAAIPSRQVMVKSNRLTSTEFRECLFKSEPAVVTQAMDDEVSIDLRWVSPDQQSKIAERIGRL